MQLRAVKDVPEGSGCSALHGLKTSSFEDKDQIASSDVKESNTNVGANLMQDEGGISEEARPVSLEVIRGSESGGEALNLEISFMPTYTCESSGKRKAFQEISRPLDDSEHCSDGSQDSASKKQKTVPALDATKSSEAIPSQDKSPGAKTKSRIDPPIYNSGLQHFVD